MKIGVWDDDIIYHVYLPSFKDSNGDGVGDFPGLISKLDYFVELQVSTLMLSPFYPSPMKDNGYDITSFTEIDPIYGTMGDFDALMEEIKIREMNIIIDCVANHTSDQHPWFIKSAQKQDPYTNYYVWVDPKFDPDGKSVLPPNNWISVFGGSAWTYHEERKQFYLHQFLPEQPDLNYRNADMKAEMEKVLRFWLDKGVDGFRIDACSHLFESERLMDEPPSKKPYATKDEHEYLDHIYTKGQRENFTLLEEWRAVLDVYEKKSQKLKLMLVEVFEDIKETMHYYGSVHRVLANFPFNFQFYKITFESTGTDLLELVDSWLKSMPKGKSPNWVLSSHDFPRVVSRVGSTLAQSLQMLVMLLPGFSICYYGDEIGMSNADIMPEEIRDSFALRTSPKNSRDPMRTPMQWNAEKNAGFSDSDKTWLPVNPNYETVNVEAQRDDPTSFLEIFKKLVQLRNNTTLTYGLSDYPLVNDRTFSYVSYTVCAKSFVFVLNMSSSDNIIDLWNVHPLLPDIAVLEVTNCKRYLSIEGRIAEFIQGSDVAGTSTASTSDQSELGVQVHLSNITLGPHEVIVLSFIGEEK